MKTTFYRALCCIVLLLAWVKVLPAQLRAQGNPAQDSSWPKYTGRLVASQDHEVGAWPLPEMILGRPFWSLLNTHTLRPEAKEINQLPMVREAMRLAGNAPGTPGAHGLKDKDTGEIYVSTRHHGRTYRDWDRDVPFIIMTNRGHDRIFRDLIIREDCRAEYFKWKEENPHWLGFWVAEWDNMFSGLIWGDHSKMRLHPSARARMKEFQNPKDRHEAVRLFRKYYDRIVEFHFGDPDKLMFLIAGWCFDHYPLEWGAGGIPWLETTATGRYRYQVSLSFTRGAARQYGNRPWAWYIAKFYNAYDKDGVWSSGMPCYLSEFVGKGGAHGLFGPDYGISVSLNKRTKYLAYLTGANIVAHESWPATYCQDKNNDGIWKLSPHGEVMNEWYTFATERYPQRGISYAPVALLLPFSHGQRTGGGNIWEKLPPKRHDRMIDAFTNTIVPYTMALKEGKAGCLANSPYGDIYDVLLPNPPSGPVSLDVLNNYKAAILLGKFDIDKPFAQRLMEYVKAGGTLFINIKQVNEHFPVSFLGAKPTSNVYSVEQDITSLMDGEQMSLSHPYEYQQIVIREAKPVLVDGKNNVMVSVNKYGKGHLVLSTVDYLLPKDHQMWRHSPFPSFLLNQIVEEVLPLQVKGDIQYGLNKLEDGWVVYLINNKGVYKWARTPQKLNPGERARVEIVLKEIKPTRIIELREDKKVSWDRKANSFFIEVGPGDVKVVKINTEKLSPSH